MKRVKFGGALFYAPFPPIFSHLAISLLSSQWGWKSAVNDPQSRKTVRKGKSRLHYQFFEGEMFGENFMQKLISYPMISALHLVKIARLVAHHWKNNPKWLLERCRICMTFWGRFGPSKLRHNFFVFQIIVKSGIIFAIKSCQINWLNRRIHNLEICLQKKRNIS